MDDWQPFNYHLVLNGANTTREDVLFNALPEQWIHELASVALQDVDNSVTSARLVVTKGVSEEFYRQWTTLSAATIYYENRMDLPLAPGERAGVAFYGITAGDELHVYLRGRRKRVG